MHDIDKAIYYLTQAANNNYMMAEFLLGLIYSQGKYTSRDVDKAIHYFILAANQG